MRLLPVLALLALSACASKIDPQLAAQNLANVQTISADNAELAAKAKLDPVSTKVYRDHGDAAVKLAQAISDGAGK